MLFNSLSFLIFIILIFMIYPRLKLRGQNAFLCAASYVFYGYWDWRFDFLLFGSTIINFWLGSKIHHADAQTKRKWFLVFAVSINLGILGFFKYYNFFLDSAAVVLTSIGFKPDLPLLRVILPVGISFYTFQTMSYAIDIYRCRLEPAKHFLDFALFISFFPQLVAGPIERAKNLLPQISSPRNLTIENTLSGLNLVLLGYFKKVAIADTLAPMVESIFASPGEMSSGQLWTGVFAFTLQIYGDFSGYTDIARGIARMLGFELMQNFNAPYLSRNITEFWRRWHISLSSWLRDYLYIPLGGNRLGKMRTYVNLIVTMLLGGLWHGAAWNFVFWGLLHGIYLAGHRLIFRNNTTVTTRSPILPAWIRDVFSIIVTFLLVALTWVFFRSPDLRSSFVYLRGLFQFKDFTGFSFSVVIAGFLIFLLDFAQTWYGSHTWLAEGKGAMVARYALCQVMVVSVLAASVAHINTITPFIYFQF